MIPSNLTRVFPKLCAYCGGQILLMKNQKKIIAVNNIFFKPKYFCSIEHKNLWIITLQLNRGNSNE
jgi:hypothetical protein